MDSTLTIIAAIGLGLALAAGFTAHTRADDRVRGELRKCLAHDEVDDLCWETVRLHNARMERMACACWEVEP